MQGRWLDWLILAVGTAVSVSWAWHGMIGPGMAAMLMLGMAIVLAACMSITRPGLVFAEVCVVVLAVLLVVSPWAIGFTGEPLAAWTAWTGGVVAGVSALVCLPLSRRENRRVSAYENRQRV